MNGEKTKISAIANCNTQLEHHLNFEPFHDAWVFLCLIYQAD